MSALQDFIDKATLVVSQKLVWGDMDAYKHINNTRYFRYFEDVRVEYFENTGINQLMADSQLGPILGETYCKYLAPLTYPDKIYIATTISEVNPKRFTMQYEIFSEKFNKVVAIGSGEIVYVDYHTGKTCLIPEEIVLQLKG